MRACYLLHVVDALLKQRLHASTRGDILPYKPAMRAYRFMHATDALLKPGDLPVT